MKYCEKCGKEVPDNAEICDGCGCMLPKQANQDNSINGGLVFLAILIPLFGIIYWPVNARHNPKGAAAVGWAAIISWVICFFIFFAISNNN